MPVTQKRKRKRTDDSESSQKIVLKTHVVSTVQSDFWFEDGNVVLQAGETQFRVHQGIVAMHSIVLKKMMTECQEKSDLDGCRLLLLTDSPSDLKCFLKALYDRNHYKEGDPQPLSTVAAMIRLGKKYKVDSLRDDAIARLSFTYPSILESLDKIYRDSATSKKIFISGTQPLEVLEVVREIMMLHILPILFFSLSCSYTRNRTYFQLSQEDKILRLRGESTLPAITRTMFSWLLENKVPSLGCRSKKDCTVTLAWCMVNLGTQINSIWELAPWDFIRDSMKRVRDFCPECTSVAEPLYEEKRRAIWEDLPSYFDLPKWEDLRQSEVIEMFRTVHMGYILTPL